ncbi:MAG: hypothetical protein E6Q76_12905 [Rhizobium sp.]|nr:MAG: hypothetical protein E6Q76_12905 [Rhizobium sp.]
MSFQLTMTRKGKKDSKAVFTEDGEGNLVVTVYTGESSLGKTTEVPKGQCASGSAYAEAKIRAKDYCNSGWFISQHNPPDGTQLSDILLSVRWQPPKVAEAAELLREGVQKWAKALPGDATLVISDNKLIFRGALQDNLISQVELPYQQSLWAGNMTSPMQAIAAVFLQKEVTGAFALTLADKPFDAREAGAIPKLLEVAGALGTQAYAIAGDLGLVFNVSKHVTQTQDAWF